MSIVDMMDAIHTSAHNIPVNVAKVAGYVTGSGLVPWTAADFGRFDSRHTGKVHINQSLSAGPFIGNVLDIENQAWTVRAAVAALKARHDAGRQPHVYCSGAILPNLKSGLIAEGFAAHEVGLWLANWNLSRTQAIAAVVAGDPWWSLQAIQWASPTSNPTTPLPGTGLTLAQANIDLSVAQEAWFPPVSPTPPPPPPASLTGVLVELPSGHTHQGTFLPAS